MIAASSTGDWQHMKVTAAQTASTANLRSKFAGI
jgi:hypothetical protein